MKFGLSYTRYKHLIELVHAIRSVGFVRLLPLIGSYTRFRYFTILIGIVSLYFNYKYNVTVHLGNPQVNNFIDFVVSSSDFFVVFVFIFFVLARYRLAQLVLLVTAIPVLIGFLLRAGVRDLSQGAAIWQWVLTLSRIGVYSWIFVEIARLQMIVKTQKFSLFVGVALLSLFDYYLISDSLIPTLLVVSFIASTTPTSDVPWFNSVASRALGLWFVINTTVSVYQIFTGHSFGLKYLGEPYVQVLGDGIARQIVPFFNEIIIRPYGLTPHPNILGGISLLGIYLASVKPFKIMLGRRGSILITICAGLSLYLSMSRNAYVACALVVIFLFVGNSNNSKQKLAPSLHNVLSITIAISASGLVFLTTFNRLATSDIYRLNDTLRFFQTLPSIPLWNYIFGLGLGQYPLYLYNQDIGDALISLAAWEYQPVHSIPLYLLLSFGLLGTLAISGFVVNYNNRFRSISPALPLVLYIQWYNSVSPQRNLELLTTLKHNAMGGLFQQIVIMYEKKVDLHELEVLQTQLNTTFAVITVPKRLAFSDVYSYAQKNNNDHSNSEHIMVVANTDILFNSTLRRIYSIKSRKPLFVALTRRESNGEKMPDGRGDLGGSFYSHSQDVWICHSKNNLSSADFTLGVPGCDQRLALFAVTRGYAIINPYNLIRVGHCHASQIRSYSRGAGEYRGMRLFPTTVLDRYAVIYE